MKLYETVIAGSAFGILALAEEQSYARDFRPGDSIFTVLANDGRTPLKFFAEMWYNIFLWELFASFIMHSIAGLISIIALRRHNLMRWYSAAIVVVGLLSSLTTGVITSAAIAGVYRASNIQLDPIYAMVWGVGQSAFKVGLSFNKILASL
ncbi:transmembrane protein 170B-like [Paramacrobiotus metropolitanus]|uniref:transmembrane protein 170B-like n=1 Tax=Paramacrobiotus metropolitanus TaxID=2943436 RepID=UPI002445BA56|nr:transmembrane protein 170B-like [Paramacrobiotus metropolitanus]